MVFDTVVQTSTESGNKQQQKKERKKRKNKKKMGAIAFKKNHVGVFNEICVLFSPPLTDEKKRTTHVWM